MLFPFHTHRSFKGFLTRPVGISLAAAFVLALTLLVAPIPGTAAAERQTEDGTVHLPLVIGPCWPDVLPTGAIPGQPNTVFCRINAQGPDTSQEATNAWLDTFDHGLDFASFEGTPYQVFETVGFIHQTLHWRHANHWMVDLANHAPETPSGWVRGGSLMRPDSTFSFEDGLLVVEADVAAGIEAYEGNAWPEIVITTGGEPTDAGSLYAYDMFPSDFTIGCRLQASRYPVCALKLNDGDVQAGKESTRAWEMSAHQPVGKENFGGSPFEGRDASWNICTAEDPDMVCRDHFRLELTRSSLTLYVNGTKYFEQQDIPPLPEEMLSEDLYVYFASMVVSHPDTALRFHWDRLSVNPELVPPE